MGAREEFMANMTELGTMETEMLLYLYGFFFSSSKEKERALGIQVPTDSEGMNVPNEAVTFTITKFMAVNKAGITCNR